MGDEPVATVRQFSYGISAALREQFNQALARFKRGERYQQLLTKYQLQPR